MRNLCGARHRTETAGAVAQGHRVVCGGPAVFRVAVVWLCLAGALLAQSEQLLEQAEGALRSGDLDRAQTIARQVAAKNPGSAPAHMILGVIAAQRRQWEAATKHFGAVVRLAPADPNGYFYLGQAYLYQQKWEEAVKYFSKALERNYPDRERLSV